ncbi:hypothetical protein AALM99_03900 [Lactococcus muris]|uniref:Uncharacterized protein n=1 Tax=Lactococcus muris TaxID=2941330 RepID=A0ABV4D946_9LACT|nr:hypothetical protein [Lactococcus garvieae]
MNKVDNLFSAMEFKNSYRTEEKESQTGKEYLDKRAKEREKKRREDTIKAQQKISGGGNPATLGS